MGKAKDNLEDFAFVQSRAIAYHEGGTLLLLNLMALTLSIALGIVLLRLYRREQVFSVPDIYNTQPLDLKWGPHE